VRLNARITKFQIIRECDAEYVEDGDGGLYYLVGSQTSEELLSALHCIISRMLADESNATKTGALHGLVDMKGQFGIRDLSAINLTQASRDRYYQKFNPIIAIPPHARSGTFAIMDDRLNVATNSALPKTLRDLIVFRTLLGLDDNPSTSQVAHTIQLLCLNKLIVNHEYLHTKTSEAHWIQLEVNPYRKPTTFHLGRDQKMRMRHLYGGE
jgi:hypothetical protein